MPKNNDAESINEQVEDGRDALRELVGDLVDMADVWEPLSQGWLDVSDE